MSHLKSCLLIALAAGAVILLWLSHDLRILSVASGSMAPLIAKSDAVVLRPANPADIQAGDIVSYVSPSDSSIIVTHRVVQVFSETGRLVTKGDANASADPAFHASRVLGEVRYVLPGAGPVVDGLRSWLGIIVTVYVPMGLLLAHELVRVVRHYDRPTYSLWRRVSKMG